MSPTLDAGGDVGIVQPQDFEDSTPFEFESGEVLESICIRYETYGHLNAAGDNAILVCHALSGDHHCAGIHSLNDPKPGWWHGIVGPGRPLDTSRFFVICSNCIGGCQGSTGPSSIKPGTDRPYASDFPFVTIGDMVAAQYRLMRHLGVESLHSVIGGSMGGMQVLEWIRRYPQFVRSAIPLATTARQNTQAIAFNAVGRAAILRDPDWQGGLYSTERSPATGLAIARMMAHITYLSDRGLEEKFGRSPQAATDGYGNETEFAVESYLNYQGRSFVNRFDANTYLAFTRALDHFDLYPESGQLEDAFADVEARCLVVGFTSDWLFPPDQNRAIARALLRAGKRASYAELDTVLGHDSFLVRSPELFRLVDAFLNAPAG